MLYIFLIGFMLLSSSVVSLILRSVTLFNIFCTLIFHFQLSSVIFISYFWIMKKLFLLVLFPLIRISQTFTLQEINKYKLKRKSNHYSRYLGSSPISMAKQMRMPCLDAYMHNARKISESGKNILRCLEGYLRLWQRKIGMMICKCDWSMIAKAAMETIKDLPVR